MAVRMFLLFGITSACHLVLSLAVYYVQCFIIPYKCFLSLAVPPKAYKHGKSLVHAVVLTLCFHVMVDLGINEV